MDKAKKKRLRRYLSWAAIACLVALLTAMPLMAKREVEAEGPQASILNTTVQPGTIEQALRGGGTLESVDDVQVKIPTGVKITGFLVKNGQQVQAGDPLVTVDKVSVMTAITQVTETMEFLREEIQDNRNEKADTTIKAAVGGRVKVIFAQEGESAQDVMLRNGALALLSIDGRMAVKTEAASTVQAGAYIPVTLSDGTQVNGRVESNLDGVVTVTVEDEGYLIGETVQVGDLGSGELYVHNAWKATGYAGTISRVHADQEQTLSAGAKLFTLTDTEYTAQLQYRAAQHREYELLLQELLTMYESGTIDAPCDGEVSGVDRDSPFLLSAQGEFTARQLTAASGYQILWLSNKTYICQQLTGCVGEEHDKNCVLSCTLDEDCESENHKDECVRRCTRISGCPAENHYSDCITHCAHADEPGKCTASRHYADCIGGCANDDSCKSQKHLDTCIKLCISSDGTRDCPGKTHRTSCIERCSHATVAGQCDADEHHHYIDCIESCRVATSAADSCPAATHKDGCFFQGMTFQATAAKVYMAGSGGMVVFMESNPVPFGVEKTAAGWQPQSGRIDETLLVKEVPLPIPGSFNSGDIILFVTGYKGGTEVWGETALYKAAASGGAGGTGGTGGYPGLNGGLGDLSGLLGGMDLSGMMGGMDIGGMTGGFAGFGNYSAGTQTQDEGLYDLEGSTLLTVSPQKQMKLVIQLDEQDIALVSTGMEAQVKLEALRGQSFAARVTRVHQTGSNSGGSSKYAVELILDMPQGAIPGMSATASIPLGQLEGTMTLPVEALAEDRADTVVYTALDESTGEPGDPVVVTTGLSDGLRVQILSGLEPGDTVYYTYYDTLELDTSAEAERFTFG